MYLSVPLITLYLIFIGHLLTLLCGFSGPFISPLIGSHEGSGARASDEIRVCVVFNFQPCKFHALFAVCPAGTGGRFPPGRQRGLPRRALPPGAGRSRDGQAWLLGALLPCPSPGHLWAGAGALQALGAGEGSGAQQAPDCSPCATACRALCRGNPGLWLLVSLQPPARGTDSCAMPGAPTDRAQPPVLTLPWLWVRVAPGTVLLRCSDGAGEGPTW